MKSQPHSTNSKLTYDLMDIIDKQSEMICKLNQTVYSLANENAEKENMIHVLLEGCEGFY